MRICTFLLGCSALLFVTHARAGLTPAKLSYEVDIRHGTSRVGDAPSFTLKDLTPGTSITKFTFTERDEGDFHDTLDAFRTSSVQPTTFIPRSGQRNKTITATFAKNLLAGGTSRVFKRTIDFDHDSPRFAGQPDPDFVGRFFANGGAPNAQATATFAFGTTSKTVSFTLPEHPVASSGVYKFVISSPGNGSVTSGALPAFRQIAAADARPSVVPLPAGAPAGLAMLALLALAAEIHRRRRATN